MKICEMTSVREWVEGAPVELWLEDSNGRLVIRAYSECGNSIVDIDLLDVVAWCQLGPREEIVINGETLFRQHLADAGASGD